MKRRTWLAAPLAGALAILVLASCSQPVSTTQTTTPSLPTASPLLPSPTNTPQPIQASPQPTDTPTQETQPSQGEVPTEFPTPEPVVYRGTLTTTIILDVDGRQYQHTSQHNVQVQMQPSLRAEAGLDEDNPFNLIVTPEQLLAPGALMLSTAEYSSSQDKLEICKQGIGSCLYVVKMWTITGTAQRFSGTMKGSGLVDVAGVSVNTGNTLVALECGGPLSPPPPAQPTCTPCGAYLVPGTTMSGSIADTRMSLHIEGSAQGLTCGGMGAPALPFSADIEASREK